MVLKWFCEFSDQQRNMLLMNLLVRNGELDDVVGIETYRVVKDAYVNERVSVVSHAVLM